MASEADRKRVPWWRTTRALTITRREFELRLSAAAARRPLPESLAGVTRFFGGAHHLADKTFVADASRPDAYIVVAACDGFASCHTLEA